MQKDTFYPIAIGEQKYSRKTPVLESLSNKAAGLQPLTLLKRDSDVDVSCEYYKTLRTVFL